jgi:hypothetical protein
MKPSKYEKLKFYTDKELQEIKNDIIDALTIPVNVQMEGNHVIYDFQEIKKLLKDAKRIIVQECGCKTNHGNCDNPMEVCLTLDYMEDKIISEGSYNPREIDLEEALEVLKESHQSGLVHISYLLEEEEKPSLICNCCPCCCHTLGGLVRNKEHAPIIKSKYIANHYEDNYMDCGICA